MKRIIVFVLTAVLVAFSIAMPAAAFDSVGQIKEFNELDGNYQYLTEKYRDNYYLDIEELGILDSGPAIVNDMANVLFSVVSFLGYCIVAFFYFCFSFDINELFGTQIEAIQAVTKNSIFDSFFILAFAFAAWELAKKLFRRNLSGMMIDGAKIVVILLLSSFVVRYSATTLTAATNITKDLGVAALSGLSGGTSTATTSYAVSVSASLWKSLVHDPWVTFEFGSDGGSESDIQDILSKQPGSEARQAIIQDFAEDEDESTNLFNKDVGRWRVGGILVYLIPFLVKSAVFVLMAVIQIAFQVMALFFVLLAPVILLMSLVPALGGIDLITLWLKKVFETQLMILIITFLIGVIVKVDALLYSKTPDLGWMIVILMETLISLIVSFNYKSIISGLGKVNKVVRNPNLFQQQLRRSGDAMQAARSGADTLGRGTQKTADIVGAAGSGAVAVGKGTLNVAKRIQRFAATEYDQLLDYYSGKEDDSEPDAAPRARQRVKGAETAQHLPPIRRPKTVDFTNAEAEKPGSRRSRTSYVDVSFVEVPDKEAKAVPRPSTPRVDAARTSGAFPAAAQRPAAATVTKSGNGTPAATPNRPVAAEASFRRPTAPTDTAADEATAARPRAAATAGRTPGHPPAENTPVANARKSPPEDGKQMRRPRVTAARRNTATAAADPAAASPASGQPHSATMAAFRRPAAAATDEQPVSRPNAAASGNAAQESAPVSRPAAAAASVEPAAAMHQQPASQPNTKNAPVQRASAPAPSESKATVKARPGGRAAPQPAAPAAQQESRHVPHATLNLAQPDIKPVARPTLQAKPAQAAPSSKRPRKTADKPSRRPPARTPAGAKAVPAGDAATTPRPVTPSKPK